MTYNKENMHLHFFSMPPPVCSRYKEDRFQGESVATTILRVQA